MHFETDRSARSGRQLSNGNSLNPVKFCTAIERRVQLATSREYLVRHVHLRAMDVAVTTIKPELRARIESDLNK